MRNRGGLGIRYSVFGMPAPNTEHRADGKVLLRRLPLKGETLSVVLGASLNDAPGRGAPKGAVPQILLHVLWMHAALLWQHAIIAHAIRTGIQPTRDMHHQSMAWHACDGRPMQFFELLHSD